MRNRPQDGFFTDQGEHSYLRPVNCVIKAADLALGEALVDSDLYAARLKMREVIWQEPDGTDKRVIHFVPYVHPSGAADITIGTLATAGDGTVTFTPTKEGFFLTEAGTVVGAADEASDVAGMLLTDYYYHVTDENENFEAHRVITIEEGDLLFLAREGDVEAYMGAAVTANDILVTDASGGLKSATAINTGGTIAQYHATLVENLLATANPRYKGIARCMETLGAAGLGDIHLLLGPRPSR